VAVFITFTMAKEKGRDDGGKKRDTRKGFLFILYLIWGKRKVKKKDTRKIFSQPNDGRIVLRGLIDLQCPL
jgi:hypothetical protein